MLGDLDAGLRYVTVFLVLLCLKRFYARLLGKLPLTEAATLVTSSSLQRLVVSFHRSLPALHFSRTRLVGTALILSLAIFAIALPISPPAAKESDASELSGSNVLLSGKGLNPITAREHGDGRFATTYLPEGLAIVDRYDTQIDRVDETGFGNGPLGTMSAHLIELGAASDQVKSQASVLITTVDDPRAHAEQERKDRNRLPGDSYLRLRGRHASVRTASPLPNTLSLRWVERDGFEVQIVARNLSLDETVAVALGLAEGG